MAELLPSRTALKLQGQGLSDGLRNIMMFVRQLHEGKYEVKPGGMRVIEGLIFAHTVLLDDYLDQVDALSAAYVDLAGKARSFITAMEVTDGEIAEAAGCIRSAISMLAEAKSMTEAWELGEVIRSGLEEIERRLVRPGAASVESNVLPFVRPSSLSQPSGGAA